LGVRQTPRRVAWYALGLKVNGRGSQQRESAGGHQGPLSK
jgi:hypothetical protein